MKLLIKCNGLAAHAAKESVMSFANIAGAIRNLISDFLVQANHVQVEQTDQIEQVDQADQNFVRQQQQLHVRLKDIADRYAHVGAKLR